MWSVCVMLGVFPRCTASGSDLSAGVDGKCNGRADPAWCTVRGGPTGCHDRGTAGKMNVLGICKVMCKTCIQSTGESGSGDIGGDDDDARSTTAPMVGEQGEGEGEGEGGGPSTPPTNTCAAPAKDFDPCFPTPCVMGVCFASDCKQAQSLSNGAQCTYGVCPPYGPPPHNDIFITECSTSYITMGCVACSAGASAGIR